ncbi:sulfur oxidation c-type cytochrome SoxX [Rhodovulum sp. YEN HP10]|uniref:sulfur oxidation c-type cytochrome SoxX n=1 Tax=Rhodovulum sp. HP10 TaxID=3387397 RepID=UPI0039E18A47
MTACLALWASVAPGAAAEVAPQAVAVDPQGHVALPLTDAPGDPAQGRRLMTDRSVANCIACHQVTEMSDAQFPGTVGPSLDGVAARYPEAMIRGILVNSKNVFPGTVMPGYYRVEGFNRPGIAFTSKPIEGEIRPLMTAGQIEDVVAYLMTLTQ